MPFGLVEYVATLGEYMKDKVVRPELEGQKINPDWSTVMYGTDSDKILLQPSVFFPILYFTFMDKGIGFNGSS